MILQIYLLSCATAGTDPIRDEKNGRRTVDIMVTHFRLKLPFGCDLMFVFVNLQNLGFDLPGS